MKILPLLFLAIASQGIFLSLLVFTRKKMVRGNRSFLAALILGFSILLLFWVAYWNQLEMKFTHFNYVYSPFPFLIPPFLFFYIKSFFKKVRLADLMHLLPFLILCLYFTPFYALGTKEKNEILCSQEYDQLLWNWDTIQPYFNYFHLVFFSVYAIGVWMYIRSQLKTVASEDIRFIRKWLLNIVAVFSFFTFTEWVSFVCVNCFSLGLDSYYLAGASVGFLIYRIGFTGLNDNQYVKALSGQINGKYQRSALSPHEVPTLISSIIEHLESHKPFLREDYKLSDLAAEVSIPSHHISELLNSYHHQNFSSLVNTYRIEEAKKLLLSEAYQNMKVSVVGYDVGFNSRTTYYQWFRKVTGESPASYQKRMTSPNGVNEDSHS